jgi:glycine cleavage system H protein
MTKKFTPTHEWISLEGHQGTVGISRYAQKELGEIVYVQLPNVGQSLQAGEEVCVLESTKAAADVYSPVSGKITAVNEAVAQNPKLLNEAAESTAWLYKIDLKKPSEMNDLLSKSDYESLIAGRKKDV